MGGLTSANQGPASYWTVPPHPTAIAVATVSSAQPHAATVAAHRPIGTSPLPLGSALSQVRIRCIKDESELNKPVTAEKLGEDGEEEEDDPDDDTWLKLLEKSLFKMKLLGVPDVSKVYIQEKKRIVWSPEGGFSKVDEWVLETDGTNLMAVLAYPTVDPTRTISNDICEIMQVRGRWSGGGLWARSSAWPRHGTH